MSLFHTVIAFILFTLEWYHIVGHSVILFRIRLLPRKDLLRLRIYFLIDTATVFVSSIVFTGQLRWLAVLQIIQHLYYFFFWNQTFMAKKIVTWSSLDWFKSDLRTRWELDSILGTLFDVAVHVCMAYYLAQYLNTIQVFASLILVQMASYFILFGPYYAWANPNNIPAWIQKRINANRPTLEQ